jgi:CHASE2 domain-containing sensor protein
MRLPALGMAFSMQALLQSLARLPHNRIRWGLLVAIGIYASIQLLFVQGSTDFNHGTYDQMVKRRLLAPSHDPAIVLVDIDEASLEAMKGEFGRWPWPRETLAGATDWLERQQAQAVVYDILFADPDTLNPASDAAFVDMVQGTRNTFFPILRLNPANDALSQVRADQLPGFAAPVPTAKSQQGALPRPAPTVAVVPPTFQAMVDSGRLGYHNVYPDEDGVVRRYRLWEDKEGWRLHSLPARIAQVLGWKLPEDPDVLIQYTKDKHAYTRVPFSEVWRLSQSRDGQKQDPRFKDAIVIIGATATSLFDVKVTPLDTVHYGAFVLANVIDNVRHGRFLGEMGKPARLFAAWLALLAMGWASGRLRQDHLKWAVVGAPTVFLALSFGSLHSGLDFFLDLTPSASHALVFFSAWSAYEGWRTRHFAEGKSQHRLAADRYPEGLYEACLALHLVQAASDEQQLFDALPPGIPAAQMSTLGVVERPEHLQALVGYVRLWSPDPQALTPAMAQMVQALGAMVQNHHIGPVRPTMVARLNKDYNFEDTMWQDLASPLAHWKDDHDAPISHPDRPGA